MAGLRRTGDYYRSEVSEKNNKRGETYQDAYQPMMKTTYYLSETVLYDRLLEHEKVRNCEE